MLELNKIYLGDCLEIMNSIDDKSVDMILCDLPYGVLNKSNSSAKWDSVIPFDVLWKQYERIIKDNGAIVLFGSGMFTANLMVSNRKMWKYNLIWHKTDKPTGFLNAKKMPLKEHEDICVFYKKLPVYNPQMVKCEYNQRNHSRGKQLGKQTNRCYGIIGKAVDFISDEKYPRSILNFARGRKEISHPVQKPLALCEYLIKTYSNEGDLVLDNCCGSGTTCLAAKNVGRNYIGIEKDENYFKIAMERLNNA